MEKVQKLFDGVYLLNMRVGSRPLQLPLLVGRDGAMLLDTGCAHHVEDDILPAMKSIGVKPADLRWIINTHCDSDHQGGNHAMKKQAPGAMLCCGTADQAQIESPDAIYSQRYDMCRQLHDHYYPPEARAAVMKDLGQAQPVDLTFSGGEKLRLSGDWELELIRLPGHSHGHLGVLDHRNHALYAGDAIHGSVYLSVDGEPALCPTYLYVQPYLSTISLIEHLEIDYYIGCHWPIRHGEEIRRFCRESRQFVESAERLALQAIAKSPATLNELCSQLSPALGSWPAGAGFELSYALRGHLEDLESRGLIERIPSSHPARYRLAGASNKV